MGRSTEQQTPCTSNSWTNKTKQEQACTRQKRWPYRYSFFRTSWTQQQTTIEQDEPRYLRLATYNCKNLKTSQETVKEILETNHLILLQETWLFHFENKLLNEIDSEICGVGKSVDENNPISPIQKPRGYGGTAIIWKKGIDKQIKSIPDGGNRILGIIINTQPRATLVLSV